MAKKTTKTITDLGEKIGGARKDMAVSTGSRAPRQPKVVDDTPAWARRYKAMADLDRRTMQPTGKWSIIDFDKNSRFGGRTVLHGLTSEADAVAKIPLAAVSRNHAVRMTNDNKFEIWRNVTDRKRVRVVPEQFTTRDDAMRYMAQNAVKILETKTGFGEEILAKPEIAKRVGPDVRNAADIAGESFMKTLGMRGVEFGNWQGDRQHVMNHAYDAFADLGHVTGIDPKDLSLKSDLGIAFGARGHGLSSARAHYEPDYGAINLTKMEGAGALAHEWFHALDHMLARMDDPRLAEKVEKGGSKVYKNALGNAVFGSHRVAGYVPQKQLPAPVRDAYKSLVDSLFHKEEKYTEDAAKVQRFSEATAKQVEERLAGLRKHLAEKLTYGKRNVNPATEAQLKRFDELAAKVKAGSEPVAWKVMANDKARTRFGVSSRYTSPVLEEMSKLFKEVRGRSGFDSQHNRGPLDELAKDVVRHQDRLKRVEESAAQTVKTKKIPTEFAREAHKLDEGRVQDYWQTNHEMAARAFSAYVEDKLKEHNRQSDYLSFGSDNKFYRMLGAKPFPEGEERAAINAKFDDLFKAMRESGVVKPAPSGVNLGWSDKARAASLESRQEKAQSKAPVEVAKPAAKTPKPSKAVTSKAKSVTKAAEAKGLKKGSKASKAAADDMFGGPSVKDQIKAAADAKAAKGRVGDPMNDGLFGSGMNQTDLVEMAKTVPLVSDVDRMHAAIKKVNATKVGSPEGNAAEAELDKLDREIRAKHGMEPHWSQKPREPSIEGVKAQMAEVFKPGPKAGHVPGLGNPQEKYWSHQTGTHTPTVADLPDGAIAKGTTDKEFESLSPGMRREIARTAARENVKAGKLDRPTFMMEAQVKPHPEGGHMVKGPGMTDWIRTPGTGSTIDAKAMAWSNVANKVGKLGVAAMIAAPVTAAMVAYDSTKRTASAAGKDDTAATVSAGRAALVAGGSAAAIGYAASKAIEMGAHAVSAVGPTAAKITGRVVPGLGVGLAALGAYQGYQRHGVTGAILGTVGADALLDIHKAPVVGGGKGSRFAGFAKANTTFHAMQATKAPKGGPKGWANPTVQAAAQAAKGRTFQGFKR